MKPPLRPGALFLSLCIAGGCTPKTWIEGGGRQSLPAVRMYRLPAEDTPQSTARTVTPPRVPDAQPVSFVLPNGWRWTKIGVPLAGVQSTRFGEHLLATRDGIHLQNILVDRMHFSHVYDLYKAARGVLRLECQHTSGNKLDEIKIACKPIDETLPACQTATGNKFLLPDVTWDSLLLSPIPRVWNGLNRPYSAGMPHADAAEVFLEGRRSDQDVKDLQVQEVGERTVAGRKAFRAVFDFRLRQKDSEGEWPAYRSVYCGFMAGEWFYGISYTAPRHHYFDRDVEAFETFLESVALHGT